MEYERVLHWQEKLGIEPGMSKLEAIDKFLVWQETKKTCERCGGVEYFNFCLVRLVCKEANEYERGRIEDQPVDNRSEFVEGPGDIQTGFVSMP